MSRIVTNTFWLILAQIGGLLISLIELPVLARALGQEMYGQVLYVLSIALIASIFVEFGFNYSAARSVVKVRDNKQKLSILVTNVLTAKLFLSLFVVAIVAIFVLSDTGMTAIPSYWMIWISLFIFAFGFTPIWYYIGIEKLIFPALLELSFRSVGLLLTILLISSPQDAQRVLIIQATVGVINTFIPTWLMLRSTGFCRISLKHAINVIQESWQAFLYKGSQSVMNSISSSLLGLLGGANFVGSFVPAEKLVRAVSGFATPVLNTLFPHLVRIQSGTDLNAKKAIYIALVIFCLGSLIFSTFISFHTEWIVLTVFGIGYQNAVVFLNILIWIIPLRVSSLILASWFISGGREQIASRTSIINILTTCLFAFLFVPKFGGIGMTIALLLAEILPFSLLLYFFVKDHFIR
ncbi:PST family polysaccharide transporter [Providencia alcalifaciens]|nr:PST family polysaccharide transporter [Providencia alcalifaciens]